MSERKTEPVEHESENPLAARIEQLKQLFPEAVNEDGIDVDTLVNLLGKEERRKERYSFTWAGKQEAILSLKNRSKATLKPAPEESLNWDSTGHLFIEGDNLEVMKLLYKSYFGRVKMIYIDPPYNTGNDFVYPDNYADSLDNYLKITGQTDEDGNLMVSNAEVNGKKHSRWLSMMYPRLFVARQMLRDDGVIFVSIDDNEVHNLRLLMDSIFGEENFIAQIAIINNPKGRVLGEHFARSHDYLIVYSRQPLNKELSVLKTDKEIEIQYPDKDERGYYRALELRNTHRQFGRFNRSKLYFPIYVNPESGEVQLEKETSYIEVYPNWDDGFEGCWTWGKQKVNKQNDELIGRYVNNSWKIYRKAYARDDDGLNVSKKLKTVWTDKKFHTEKGQAAFDELMPNRIFPSPKPVDLIKSCIELSTTEDTNDIILDFFAGSATTAQAVLEQNREDAGNRRFFMVQLPEPVDKGDFKHIAQIGEERIRRVIKQMQAEKDEKLEGFEGHPDEDLGFRVFKLDKSPMRQWSEMPANETTAEEYAKQMELFVSDPLLEGWTEQDVITEVAIKEIGFGLNYRVEQVEAVTEQTVYKVVDAQKEQAFYICLDDKIVLEALKPLKLTRDDLFIFRDSAITDTIVANLALRSRIKSI